MRTAHLVFLTAFALHLGWFHPAGITAIAVLWTVGVAAELLPRSWKAWYVGEALLTAAAAGLLSTAMPWDEDHLHPFIGMVMAVWCLVPSRPGHLQFVVLLCLAELLALGRYPLPAARPGDAPADAPVTAAALGLVPLAIAALAVNAWLAAQRGARALRGISARRGADGRWTRLAAAGRWLLLPTVAAAAIGLVGGAPLSEASGPRVRPRVGNDRGHAPLRDPRIPAGLDDGMHIGDHREVQRDPRVAARLFWDDRADRLVGDGMQYLRALALGRLVCTGNLITWRTDTDTLIPVEARPAGDAPRASVLRLASGDDVVLRWDGAGAVDLANLLADRDGNLYQPRLGDGDRVYAIGLAAAMPRADPDRVKDWRRSPRELEGLPWARIERKEWEVLSAEDCAAAIGAALRGRCTYSLDNLPPPAPGTGGVLRTFLFGSDAERTGHCQYFATSAVVLLRRYGHAARCVIGFASDEYDERSVTFRAYHAHAWAEYVDSRGQWRRLDATPAGAFGRRSPEDFDPGSRPPPPLPVETAIDPPPAPRSAPPRWSFAAVALIAVLGLAWWWSRRRPPAFSDPRRAELERRSGDLVRLAIALGVPVLPTTTISALAAALTRRTGIDLSTHLAAHLAARFGTGPLPSPWPVEALRQAARARSAEPR